MCVCPYNALCVSHITCACMSMYEASCALTMHELLCVPVYAWTVTGPCMFICELSHVPMYELPCVCVCVWIVMCPCLCMNCHVSVSVYELSCVCVYVLTVMCPCLCMNCPVSVSMYELSNVRVCVWFVMYLCLCFICHVSVYDLSCVRVYVWTVMSVSTLISSPRADDKTVNGRHHRRWRTSRRDRVVPNQARCRSSGQPSVDSLVLRVRRHGHSGAGHRWLGAVHGQPPSCSGSWRVLTTLHQLHLPAGTWFHSHLEVLPKRFIN